MTSPAASLFPEQRLPVVGALDMHLPRTVSGHTLPHTSHTTVACFGLSFFIAPSFIFCTSGCLNQLTGFRAAHTPRASGASRVQALTQV